MPNDIRLKTTFMRHHKTQKLRKMAGAEAVCSLLQLFLSCVENERYDGSLNGLDTLDIEIMSDWEGETGAFVDACVKCGYLEKLEDGSYAIHDWELHQPWVAKTPQRSEIARRNVAKRWGGKNTGGIQTVYKRYTNGIEPLYETDTPSPSPSPSPSPKPQNHIRHKKESLENTNAIPAVCGRHSDVTSKAVDPIDMEFAKKFLVSVRKRKPTKMPNLVKWADEFRKMREIDNITVSDIKLALEFLDKSSPDNSGFCWGDVVLSPVKLRKQLQGSLYPAMQRASKKPVRPEVSDWE